MAVLGRATSGGRARFLAERQREQEAVETHQQRLAEPGAQRAQELKKLQLATGAASAEAQRERQFESQEREVAFERATQFITPFLQEGEGGGAGAEQLTGAQEALESTIERRGSQAQSRLAGILAKRGIFRSGSGAAASAQLEGETEAGVAESRARFAESAAERRQRERQSRRQTALQAFQAVGGGFA